MKILIIGAKGFIGSHLVDYFSKKGDTVVSCDSKDDPENPGYTKVDKFNADYNALFAGHKPDACIYAGGNGSVPYSIESPETDFYLNTVAVNNLLSALQKHSPSCRFIHISSAAVYGSPVNLPINEQETVKPQSPYGWHKYVSECICKKYSTLYGIKTCSMRVFSVFGERLTKQLFWDIYQKIKKSPVITLFGSGNESRDFIYIYDLIVAMDILLQKTEFNGEVINVSSGKETAIKDAASLFCRLYDPAIQLKFNNEVKKGDPSNWWADISKLKSLGFAPTVSLETGLGNYIQWLKERE
jgi:dTDP-glucose 4,6-dehydratase/UDP-glucose 4-epimerase